MNATVVSASGTSSHVLEGKAVHEETERLIERANRAIVQSLLLVEENRSSIDQAWARLRFLYCKIEEMKPKAAQLDAVMGPAPSKG
jgi:hypothetical protein